MMQRGAHALWIGLAISAGLATAFAARPGLALPFRAAIPQLVGPIAFPQLRVPFDFGQEFTHVESVSLEIVAATTPFEYDYCGTTFYPQPCVHRMNQEGFLAILDDPRPGAAFYLTEVGLGAFTETPSLQSGTFFSCCRNDFSFLRPGTGSFEIHWNATGFFPEDLINITAFPTGTIYEAYIVFDATPIPEPSTALLAAFGLALLARAKWRRRPSPSARK